MNTQANSSSMDRKEFFRLTGITIGAIVLQQCLAGCSTGTTEDPQPDGGTPDDFTFNINDSKYSALRTKGGFIRINGVIVAQTLQNAFIAVSQTCTHEGTPVNYVSSNSTFVCPNHGSVFTERGAVQTGPATKPLTVYKTSFDATTGEVRIFV